MLVAHFAVSATPTPLREPVERLSIRCLPRTNRRLATDSLNKCRQRRIKRHAEQTRLTTAAQKTWRMCGPSCVSVFSVAPWFAHQLSCIYTGDYRRPRVETVHVNDALNIDVAANWLDHQWVIVRHKSVRIRTIPRSACRCSRALFDVSHCTATNAVTQSMRVGNGLSWYDDCINDRRMSHSEVVCLVKIWRRSFLRQ